MNAVLYGGPYDGTAVDQNDINLYTKYVPVGIRKFVVMPPIDDWDAVRRGDLNRNGPFEGQSSIYELIRTPDGIEGRHDLGGHVFDAAMREQTQGQQPTAKVEFTGQYFKCYRGDLRDVSFRDDCFGVRDEKGREWECIALSREEAESEDIAEMLPHLGGEPLSEPLRIVTLHCEEGGELPAKLADVID